MEKTWRWFGKKDRITLPMLRQIGVEGIVTSVQGIPGGGAWPLESISGLKDYIEGFGLRWSVVESLPVSEAIKYAGPERDSLIDSYRQSLASLGRCGIRTVCYNFMPVIDWIRTDLEYPLPDGSSCLYFDYSEFAYFDLDILQRKDAEKDYPDEILEKVDRIRAQATKEFRDSLTDTIIVKTQGFVNSNFARQGQDPISRFRALLGHYEGIGREELRENLRYFLDAVMPVCEQYGVDMCIHPDDPPMQVLGLPRIVSDAEDIRWMLAAADKPRNGLTFCAGSLSAGAGNDVLAMAREFASRTRFVHLRSCDVLDYGNFIEAPHTLGRANLVELIRIFEKTDSSLPMRVDHGKNILGDERRGYHPGYGFHGRMLALGQVEGMMAAVQDEIKQKMI